MAKFLVLWLVQASIFANSVSCLASSGPKPTQARLSHADRVTHPEPTARALLREENSNLLGRSYNTLCGYWDGNLNYPLTCGGGYICATEAYYNAAGCCDPTELANCFLPDLCIPYGEYCDDTCLENYVAYTSCGYLYPYCLTKFYNLGAGYYEYDCATAAAFLTIEPSATNAPVTQYVVNSAAVVVQTKAASATAVAENDGTGSVTNIYNGDNDCQSDCGTGNSNGGSQNNVGNRASPTVPMAASCLRILNAVCVFLLLWMG